MKEMSSLAKKIIEIGSDELIKNIFNKAKWSLNTNDYKAGVYEIDIMNALEELSSDVICDLENELNVYRAYTAVYCKYGYKKVWAKDKAEANKTAMTQRNSADIDWQKEGYCFKIAPSKYVHEMRVLKTVKRVTHAYDKDSPMNEHEVKKFLLENNFCNKAESCVIEYTFIINGIIRKEKRYELEF